MTEVKNSKQDQILSNRSAKNLKNVSAILAEAALAPGFYLRTLEGEIIPAVFSGGKVPKDISESYKKKLSWPDVDFVYDMSVEAVFADRGKSYQLWSHSEQDRSAIDEEYSLFSDKSQYRVYSGYVTLRDGDKNSDRKHRNISAIVGSDGPITDMDMYLKLSSVSLGAQALSAGIDNLFHDQLFEVAMKALKALENGEMSTGKNSWSGITIPKSTPLDMGDMDVLTAAYRGENGNIYASLDPNRCAS